jgi:hypothetical protein
LDPDTRKKLEELRRATGWSTSRIVREGLRLLNTTRKTKKRRSIIGAAMFASGEPDLATSRRHLKGFGE